VEYRGAGIADDTGAIPARFVADQVGTGPALMNVRPELIRRIGPKEKADCSMNATVTEIFTKGGTVQYRAHTPEGHDLAIEIQGTSDLPMQVGENVRLGWAKKDIWVLPAGAPDGPFGATGPGAIQSFS
jgi:hypothetical protein